MRRALALCVLLAGCTAAPAPVQEPAGRIVWQGEVRIDQDLVLPRGSELVIEPGTVVRFAFHDTDGDGWGDVSLRVEGALAAHGTPKAPVVFTSASAPAEPGQWGEVRIDFGSLDLRYAVIEGSTRGLHAHFSRGRVADCVFRRNVDGTRFGESALEVEQCLFSEHSGKALNARKCRNSIYRNLFRGNRNGIFLFESDAGSTFVENAFRDNDHPFRLGDFFAGEVEAQDSDWGDKGPPAEAEANDAARLLATPGPAGLSSRRPAGPRGWPFWEEAWRAALGGFVDASPVLADEGLYVASWSGEVVRLGFLDGSRQGAVRLPDAVDARPALGAAGMIATQAWDRRIYLLRRRDLEVLDVFEEEASPADDHRQSGPVFSGSTLVVGTWAGRVRAFSVAESKLVPAWEFRAGGPFRANLVLAPDATVLAACQDGTLYALDVQSGGLRWSYQAGAPLLSAPDLDEKRAYLADRGGLLHAVDLKAGQGLWQARLGGGAWYGPPLLADGLLYQGEDSGRLWALRAEDGRVLWTSDLGAGVRARPAAVEEDLIAVPTVGGRVYLLSRASGFERDCLQLPGSALSSPASLGSRIFLGSRDGIVRALHVKRLDQPD